MSSRDGGEDGKRREEVDNACVDRCYDDLAERAE
jgi:hypothetical protein